MRAQPNIVPSPCGVAAADVRRWKPSSMALAVALAVAVAGGCRRSEDRAPAAAAADDPTAHATVSLAADGPLHPGQPFTLAVDLTTPPGWHTYWRNPGEAGMAPEFHWRLPEGVRLRTVEYPVPLRFEDAGIVSLGYAENVRLLAEFVTDATLKAGRIAFGLRLDWMICKEVCIPVTSAAQVAVTVATSAEAPAVAFPAARASLPHSTDDWNVRVTRLPGALRVRLEGGAAAGLSVEDWSRARVLPVRRGALDLAAAPTWRSADSATWADLALGVAAPQVGETFEALLVIADAGRARGWRLSAVVDESDE